MTHLDSVIIHNFKSFKHVNIKFSKGFNCIVGANGSGKSNICDSLLFVLGESSLKRMRVPNTTELINSFAKPKKDDGVKRAYVKVNFAGQNPLEVSRIIKSNNKISYRLNEKRVTRQEVIEALRSYKSDINETNIIAQGEITYMVGLNAKERRELIDVAAGIKEFNDKKETAMKELEKVQTRMNETQIALNERRGFLSQLEREKEDAEKFIQLTDSIKRISYTLLKNSEMQIESDFGRISDALKNLEQRKKSAGASIHEIEIMLEKLSKDKETFSNDLNKRSVELSSTNKILESINRDTAVKETQLKSLREKMEGLEANIDQLKAEQKKIKEESAEGSRNAEAAKRDLQEKERQLSTSEAIGSESTESSQISKIGQNQKRIEELYLQSDSISKQYLQYKFEMEDLERLTKSNEGTSKSKTEQHEKALKEIKQQKAVLSRAEEAIAKLAKEIESAQEKAREYQKALDKIYVESVDLREKISVLGGASDKINDYLKKNIDKGFYGRAYELCAYDEKYDVAINAAAMSRLSYLVVDSAEVADRAIKLLKGKQLGRASFIPINELVTKYKEENQGLDKLIGHVKFDSKFERAFNYIFANTYVVESIGAAKSIGFGRGRFVTLDGELVEQSGIITGGSTRQLQSPALLESKLKSLENQKFAVASSLEQLSSEIEAMRKETAGNQVQSMNCRVELKHLRHSRNL